MLLVALAGCGRAAPRPVEAAVAWPEHMEEMERRPIAAWIAARPALPGELVEREIADWSGERALVIERRRDARGCREGWHLLVLDGGVAREDGLGVTCCAGATCEADDPMAWMLRYQRARRDEDAAAMAELIHPVRGARAVVEGLVYRKRDGVTHRRDAAALIEDIEHVDLLHADLRCDAAFAADRTAGCATHDNFPSHYRWRRGPDGVFLEAVHEGDGVE